MAPERRVRKGEIDGTTRVGRLPLLVVGDTRREIDHTLTSGIGFIHLVQASKVVLPRSSAGFGMGLRMVRIPWALACESQSCIATCKVRPAEGSV